MSTQPTQAHIEMARKICGRESDSEEQEYAAQLIADSEAKAVEHAIATIIAKNAPEITKINTELAHLHDDLERFTGGGLIDCHAICDQRDAAVAERDRLRAEVEGLEARLYKGCDDERDMAISEGPWHGICGLAEELTARAKRAEAECLEQARLLGMSASREASLLGEISQLEQQLAATRAPT